jgi:hypothetical protein
MLNIDVHDLPGVGLHEDLEDFENLWEISKKFFFKKIKNI